MSEFLSKVTPYRNGLGILVIGIVAFFIIHGNPIRDLQLLRSGITVTGIAIDVNDFEDREDNGNLTRYFFIKYEFVTKEGEKISGVVEVPGNSTQKGFRTGQKLDIQYLAGSPHIHRVNALATTSTTEWILKNLVLGLLAVAPGVYLLVRAYQTERKLKPQRSGSRK